MMNKGRNYNCNIHLNKRTLIIIMFLLLLLSVGGVIAKYVWDNNGNNLISAKEFYFTSNLLKEENAKYVLNSTSTEVSFTLGNNADKLRFSEVDITYDIAVITKNGGEVPDIVDENTEHKLTAGAVDTVTITLNNLIKGETYIVTATGRAGYKQVLTAEFTVSDSEENVFKNLDTSNSSFVLLNIWTENVTGELKVNVPAGLIPDNTNPVLREVYNYNDTEYESVIFTDETNFSEKYSSYTYRFFISEGTFSVDDFDVLLIKNETEYPAEKADIPK